jgi:hypothetical protein
VTKQRYYRKIIRIRAEDSPNVQLALQEIDRGERPSNKILISGVLSWAEYQKRRKLWNPIQQTVSLDGEFYKGGEVWLFPQEALRRSPGIAKSLSNKSRRALSMGVDAAEGGDYTVWTVVNMDGIIYQLSIKTEDTADVPGRTIALMKEYRLVADQVFFDRGGGGKQHADQLRRKGYDVRTVGFGETASDPHKDRKRSSVKPQVTERVTRNESYYAYKNRRAEMYGLTSDLFIREQGFGVSYKYSETLRQLKALPKLYDGEGRLYLPPKGKPHPGYTGATIKSILGRSPDEADSLVLAVYGMIRRPPRISVGSLM